MQIRVEQLAAICMYAGKDRLAPLVEHLNKALREAEADTPMRAAMFLGQLAHESAEFRYVEERLNYSEAAILKTWPARFRAPGSAAQYAGQPEKLANHVYAGRMGNGDEASGDGWKYRGRGWIQLTGFSNYQAAGKFLGLELVAHPEIASHLEVCARVAAWFWRTRGANEPSDRGDVLAVTQIINGGTTGLGLRRIYYERACAALGVA